MQSTTNSLRSPAEELLGKPELVKRFRISFTMQEDFGQETSVQQSLGTCLWFRIFLSHTRATKAPSDTAGNGYDGKLEKLHSKIIKFGFYTSHLVISSGP